MKKLCSLFLVVLLLSGVCAGCRTQRDPTDTTAPTDAHTPVDGVAGKPAEAAASAREDTSSPVFLLEDLPDIGSYKSKAAPESYYDAPLKAFKASAGYGAIIPYQLASDVYIKAFGFMTTDGKIITAPIYSSVSTVSSGDAVVFLAKCRTQYFTPGKKRVAPEERDYQGEANEVEETMSYQLISGDGKKLVSLPAGMTPYSFSDPGTGETIIYASKTKQNGDVSFETVRFYDLALDPLSALGEYQTGADKYCAVIAKDDNGLWLFENSFYQGDGTKREQRVLCYRNGRLQRSIEVENEDTISAVAGELLIGAGHLYTMSGKEILSYYWGKYVCDAQTNCCFAIDSNLEKLVKIKNGKIEKSVVLPETEWIQLDKAVYEGKTCLLVRCESEDDSSENTLYDMDLNVLNSLPDACGFVRTVRFADWLDDYEYGPVLYYWTSGNGKAELHSLMGKLLVSLDVGDTEADFEIVGDNICYYDKDSGISFYDPQSGSVRQRELSGNPDGEVLFRNEKMLVLRRNMSHSGDWRRNAYPEMIYDLKTGDAFYENVTEFNWLDVGDRQYCTFLCGGQSYLCDGGMNVIAVIPDGYYA